MQLTLYYHPLSSYCHKVLIALYENHIEFEGRIINLGEVEDRAELQAVWPLCKFPVLHDSQRQHNVAESSIIIEYLDQYFVPAHRMIPSDGGTALEVRLWDRIFDNYVQGPLREIVNDKIREANSDLSGARATLETAYGMIDRQLTSKDWCAGENFSMADCAAAPALFYTSTLLAFPNHYVHLSAYFERLMNRPSVRRVLEEAKPYFSLYPFSSAIPARFR